MTDRMLRHKPTGVLYIYQDVFAMRPDFEEVINVEATVVEDPPPKPRRSRVTAGMEIPTIDDLQLGEDASRGLA